MIGQPELAQRELERGRQLFKVFRRKPNVTVEDYPDWHLLFP